MNHWMSGDIAFSYFDRASL